MVRESLPRRLASRALDLAGNVIGNRQLLPPFSMRRAVGEARWDFQGNDFRNTGQHFLSLLTQDAGLTSRSRVLDLGSGCGRIAIPLTSVLSSSAIYCGLEPSRSLVEWCTRNITSRFPNFKFAHCDLYNSHYNPQGKINPAEFSFPFDAGSFDLLIATSVFTHLLPETVRNYVSQSSRVLRLGGILFGSFFLIENGTTSADGGILFRQPIQDVALSIDAAYPERAMAYRLEWLLGVFKDYGFECIEPVRWGSWTGRSPAYSGQDILIFRRNENSNLG